MFLLICIYMYTYKQIWWAILRALFNSDIHANWMVIEFYMNAASNHKNVHIVTDISRSKFTVTKTVSWLIALVFMYVHVFVHTSMKSWYAHSWCLPVTVCDWCDFQGKAMITLNFELHWLPFIPHAVVWVSGVDVRLYYYYYYLWSPRAWHHVWFVEVCEVILKRSSD